MARYGDVMLRGKSGEKYCFQTWAFGTRFRSVGAVFFVTRRLITDRTFGRASHEVFYIGQSANMAEPLLPTIQLDAFEKKGANCVCSCPVSDEARRMDIFEDLVAGHDRVVSA